MKDSVFYQAIVEEGRQEGQQEGRLREAQEMVLRVGRGLLGPPDDETEMRVRSIEDLDRLERMAERFSGASDWREFLAID
jgi:predicted transposase YdaD